MLDIKKLLTKVLDMFKCDLIYDGSYTSGSASLSKSVATYKRIKILYVDNDNTTHTKEIINNNGNFTAICDVVRVTGEAYWKNMIIDFSGSSMWSSVNRQKAGTGSVTSGTYITVKKVYGYRSLAGGGYFITSLLSTIERWWRHVRCEETVDANPRLVRSPNIQHNLGWDNGSNEKALRSRARCHLESTNCCGWEQYDWDTASRMETSGGLCVDSEGTQQQFKWCRGTLYNQRIKWCVHRLQLRLCLDKQRLKYNREFHIYNITPERGCIAC